MYQKLEIKRKIVHLLLGIILVVLIFYDFVDKVVLGIITVIVFVLFYIAKFKRIFFMEWLLDNFERPGTRKTFPGRGPLFYLIGAELSLVFFAKDIAMASIIILAIGDSIPNIVGMYFGRIKRPFSDRKFIEGAIVGIILAFVAADIFVIWYEALSAAVVAIFLEGIDMKIGLEKIDDNLIVPLSAGIVISLIRWVL